MAEQPVSIVGHGEPPSPNPWRSERRVRYTDLDTGRQWVADGEGWVKSLTAWRVSAQAKELTREQVRARAEWLDKQLE